MIERFWVVGESIAPQIYGRAGFYDAIAEYSQLTGQHLHPRMLAEDSEAGLVEVKDSQFFSVAQELEGGKR